MIVLSDAARRDSVIHAMFAKRIKLEPDFFDRLSAPPLFSMIHPDAIKYVEGIVQSVKYQGKTKEKREIFKNVFGDFGFVRCAGGTNREVFKHPDYPDILVKAALTGVALQDAPSEFINQSLLKPFCVKTFEKSPGNGVSVVERGTPLRNFNDFKQTAPQIFALLRYLTDQKLLIEDIGSMFFLNYVIRDGFGPVLCDYPYVYQASARSRICKVPDEDGNICGGHIRYDEGWNQLKCDKCGRRYLAKELGTRPKGIGFYGNDYLIRKGADEMESKIYFKGTGEVLFATKEATKVIKPTEEDQIVYSTDNQGFSSSIIRVESNGTIEAPSSRTIVTDMNEDPDSMSKIVRESEAKPKRKILRIDLSDEDKDAVVTIIDPKPEEYTGGDKKEVYSDSIADNIENRTELEEPSQPIQEEEDDKEYEKPVMHKVLATDEETEEELDPYFNSPQFTIGARVGIFDITDMSQFDKVLEMKKAYQVNGASAMIRLVEGEGEDLKVTELDHNGNPVSKELKSLVEDVRKEVDAITSGKNSNNETDNNSDDNTTEDPVDNYTEKYDDDSYYVQPQKLRRKKRKFSDDELSKF